MSSASADVSSFCDCNAAMKFVKLMGMVKIWRAEKEVKLTPEEGRFPDLPRTALTCGMMPKSVDGAKYWQASMDRVMSPL